MRGHFKTILCALEHYAKHQPNQLAYTYLKDGETQQLRMTYAQLAQQAKQFATQLLTHHRPGNRALLLFHPGLDYIRALFACFYAGIIAVPAYPPGNQHYRQRLKSIASNAQADMILSTSVLINKYDYFSSIIESEVITNCYAYQPTGPITSERYPLPEITAEHTALLQYTSGSLAQPKGVIISHKNIIYNQEMIKRAFNHDHTTVFASWLPLFHDMGLMGNTLQPLYLGAHCVFMSPAKFMQSPIRWLKMISRFGATTSGAPNFAYQLCANKITRAQLKSIDLSHWRVAYCGAEPIRETTHTAFCQRFAIVGFQEQAFHPCYGLAEASLFVTGKKSRASTTILNIDINDFRDNKVTVITAQQQDSLKLVSCGHAWLDEQVLVVNPVTHLPCQENTMGEIWVSGNHIGQGYWQDEAESAAVFNAYAAINNLGPFLRTGDLGFLHNDELYITGRMKELLIINGKNYYPQDIEFTACQSHALLSDHAAATFVIDREHQQHLAIIAETKSRYISQPLQQQMVKRIKQVIYAEYNLIVQEVRLIQPSTLPKTTSGKVQRHLCRKQFLKKQLTLTKIQQLQTESL